MINLVQMSLNFLAQDPKRFPDEAGFHSAFPLLNTVLPAVI